MLGAATVGCFHIILGDSEVTGRDLDNEVAVCVGADWIMALTTAGRWQLLRKAVVDTAAIIIMIVQVVAVVSTVIPRSC